MAKHVCPICETVYAQPATLHTRAVPQTTPAEIEAWHCPECGYAFVSVTDARQLAPTADITLERHGDGTVRHRTHTAPQSEEIPRDVLLALSPTHAREWERCTGRDLRDLHVVTTATPAELHGRHRLGQIIIHSSWAAAPDDLQRDIAQQLAMLKGVADLFVR